MADKKPIDQSLIGRVASVFGSLFGSKEQSIATDNQTLFSPSNPPSPITSDEQQERMRGRQFDFAVGVNLRMSPRQGENTPFADLRALADNCDLLRLVIETRKDQMAKLHFSIAPIDPKLKADARCVEIENFLRMPDGENTWDSWLRMLLEDMFVLDAATIYPWLNNDGTPFRFELMDGSTIKRVIDERGRTPMSPRPAYQQIIKGLPVVNYTVDELVYAPRNRRTHKVYGYSPVEQVLITVNIAIRRMMHQLQYYTEGSTPDLLFQTPSDWNMSQIKDFNDWWQSTISGNTGARRKAQFVPNGVTPINTKEGILTDKYDEWLARIICYAFSVSHQAFVAQINRSTAETAHQQSLEDGILPVMKWVKSVMDTLIWKYFGCTDIEFKWKDQDSISFDLQSQIDDRSLKNGSATINEIRAKRGDEPVQGGDIAMTFTSQGYVPIDAYFNQVNAPKLDEKNNELSVSEKINKSEDADVPMIDRDRAIIAKTEKQLTKDLGNIFSKIYSEVEKNILNLNKAEKNEDINEPNYFDGIEWQKYTDSTAAALIKNLKITIKSGVEEAYKQLNLFDVDVFDLANLDAIEWAKIHGAELVGMKYNGLGDLVPNPNAKLNILETTREMIRADISKALEQGLAPAQLAKELKNSYAFSAERSKLIARTELARADIAGNLVVYKKSNVVDEKKWITGAGCCDKCQALNGVKAPIDGQFPVGSDPPLHPRCRCDVTPVINFDNYK